MASYPFCSAFHFHKWKSFTIIILVYGAVRVGLLIPLTFAQHHLSPLTAFTSGTYFLHNARGDSEFANFTLPTLKTFLEACSQNVSGNKQ